MAAARSRQGDVSGKSLRRSVGARYRELSGNIGGWTWLDGSTKKRDRSMGEQNNLGRSAGLGRAGRHSSPDVGKMNVWIGRQT